MHTDQYTSFMDIPDLVQQALDGEEIQAGVSLGDEDAVCLTPTRTLVYKGEGLLSDEQVHEYSHDVERLFVKEGRRKTEFVLEYLDGKESFTVPSNRGEKVLELLLEGILRIESVIQPRESVLGVYRFSELTLVVTEGRLIKHIGEQVWNGDDYESYNFEDVTRLEFERASVATSVAVTVDGRPQRVKVPNDKAPLVRQTLEEALCDYYDVSSLEELNVVVGETDAGGDDADAEDDSLDFGEGIDPLVTDHEDEIEDPMSDIEGDTVAPAEDDRGESTGDATSTGEATPSDAGASPEPGETAWGSGTGSVEPGSASAPDADAGEKRTATDEGQTAGASADDRAASGPDAAGGDTAEKAAPESQSDRATARGATESDGTPTATETDEAPTAAESDQGPSGAEPGEAPPGAETVSQAELAAVVDRVDELTEAVDRQNELLKRQHRAIKQLAQQLDSE
ncbi:MAG: hypothetical protein ABEJ40_08225 [Haloarculaceae archaeon]